MAQTVVKMDQAPTARQSGQTVQIDARADYATCPYADCGAARPLWPRKYRPDEPCPRCGRN